MANSDKDSRQNISLEDLLRFKRAERPEQAFWEQFDQELHQRMMQTLVKKDPWYTQVLCALTGRFAQSTAVAAAAAVLALVVVRPAFVASNEFGQPAPVTLASAATASEAAAMHEPAAMPLETSSLIAEADYSIEGLTAATVVGPDAVTRDFGMDQMHVVSYDKSAYSADMALSGLATAGVASIVY